MCFLRYFFFNTKSNFRFFKAPASNNSINVVFVFMAQTINSSCYYKKSAIENNNPILFRRNAFVMLIIKTLRVFITRIKMIFRRWSMVDSINLRNK